MSPGPHTGGQVEEGGMEEERVGVTYLELHSEGGRAGGLGLV